MPVLTVYILYCCETRAPASFSYLHQWQWAASSSSFGGALKYISQVAEPRAMSFIRRDRPSGKHTLTLNGCTFHIRSRLNFRSPLGTNTGPAFLGQGCRASRSCCFGCPHPQSPLSPSSVSSRSVRVPYILDTCESACIQDKSLKGKRDSNLGAREHYPTPSF